jgi:hypothetical protein
MPNKEFHFLEDLSNPGFSHLIEKYKLDTIFHGEEDEFKRILLLRHWIKSVIRIEDHSSQYSGEGYAEGILDAALSGEGFHCGHFMVVQNAVLNAYGYVTRAMGAGPGIQGEEGPDGHHGINEVWINKFSKWVLSDAKYDHHFENNGIPLSSLEVRDEYLKNMAVDIQLVQGPDRKVIDFSEELNIPWERFARTYTWITWQGNGNFFTAWPDHKEIVVMYEDDFYKENIWIRDGKPCWIYDHLDVLNLIEDRDLIEWTPNTIASEVSIDGNRVSIYLRSDTPNLKEYQMKESASAAWNKVDERFDLKLKEKKYKLIFRSVNLANVTGPEHKIIIENH